MIRALRILPPFAIGRLGSAEAPLDDFALIEDPERPLGPRRIVPLPTLVVDPATGALSERPAASEIAFKDGEGRIRPVAPFLEVFAVDQDGAISPLTLDALAALGVGPEAVRWRATLANRKAMRRTADPDDAVTADTGWFGGHDPIALEGGCPNFLPGATVDFGRLRYLRPNAAFPEIRARFTPPKGLIYGPDPEDPAKPDPVLRGPDGTARREVYDRRRGWVGFDGDDARASGTPLGYVDQTLPPSLYAISGKAPTWLNDNIAVSRGYLDDVSDGVVEVRLDLPDGRALTAAARICAGPPDIAPDAMFLRTLADDFEQVVHGPALDADAPEAEVRARALDAVRRAFETMRFMNLAVMNGNDFKGRSALLLDSMPQEEAADTERALRPVMPPESVDTLVVAGLHAQVLATLRSGAAPWFARLIRRPEEVADFTDFGRRKMPAMMCGADNGYLSLTRRQIDAIERAYGEAPGPAAPTPGPAALRARNRTAAEILHVARGNPPSSRPESAVANCCPGLELDFRAVWRRVFRGVELREYDNLVVRSFPDLLPEGAPDLTGRRLLRVRASPDDAGAVFTAQITGPAVSDVEGRIRLTTDLNPEGLAPLEWSNALAPLLATLQGRTALCDFTLERTREHQALREAVDGTPANYETFELAVETFFEPDTGLISRVLAEPGELTQGLCSPWQNDYRECSCYYWASSRPDFVNVETTAGGLSEGDNWLQKRRTGRYVPDDYQDTRLMLYDDLFTRWETLLRFQIGGRDAPGERGDAS